MFYAKTDDMKHKWIEAINKALDNDCPLACREGYTDHTFAMFTFPSITTCVGCQQLLKRVFFQGYQCTVCHIAVHKECITSVPSCGAPSLPPRPPLPPSSPGLSLNSFNEDDTHSNGGASDANLRLSYESPTSLDVLGVHQQSQEQALNLEDYDWFAGPLDRESAQSTLENMSNGSFLVRISPKQRGSYAISLNYSGQVKHMRVQQTNDHQYYYLSETRYFKTITDLVVYYEENSLCESFNLVDTNLMIPYKKALSAEAVAYAIALYSFTGSSANLLDLRKGDRVAILSKAGESKGWWKGQINDRVGYFPLAYVTQTQDML
jgi:guanine nucleotide exchange factor VAV